MPRYDYHCEGCGEYFEITHSMTESLENCQECDSQAFSRIPSIPSYITRKAKSTDVRVGSIVEEYIKMNKESVKEEKEKLKRQEYKNE